MFDYYDESEVNSDRLYATQGGGTAVFDGNQYLFKDPPNWGGFKSGDPVPLEWSVVAIRNATHDP